MANVDTINKKIKNLIRETDDMQEFAGTLIPHIQLLEELYDLNGLDEANRAAKALRKLKHYISNI